MVCGWCKQRGLDLVWRSELDPLTDQPVRTGDKVLKAHISLGTRNKRCRGPETHRTQDALGVPGR